MNQKHFFGGAFFYLVGMIRLAVIYLIFSLLLSACKNDSNQSNEEAETLVIPDNGYDFKLYQRKQLELPTSLNHKLVIEIDDITHGQTIISISLNDDILVHQSVSEGDEVFFHIGHETYSITCIDQINYLIGEDVAYFSIHQTSNNTINQISDETPNQEKIEKFIISIENSDVTFIRNGGEYSPKEAADHLRKKWKNAGVNMTLQEFIENVASKSSLSGKPYQVKLSDGSIINAKEWYSTLSIE